MKRLLPALLLLLLLNQGHAQKPLIRNFVDTVGFAHLSWQMDSIVHRIERQYGKVAPSKNPTKLAICPHDDYTYAGYLYPRAISNIKARTIILLGVAHKARLWNLENQLVFESFSQWKSLKGTCPLSPLKQELMDQLTPGYAVVHDSLQLVEHSLEAMVPFIQYYHPNAEIIPILVPAMSFQRMDSIASSFARSVSRIMQRHHLSWGKDISILVTTDAVHYGDDGWGGKNYAPFGVDSAGYKKAVKKEHSIVDRDLKGALTKEKAKDFFYTTVQKDDFRNYQWTWCGRYSVPFGLMVADHLTRILHTKPLTGIPQGYANSIDHQPLPVSDLRMGVTAPASLRHWVGYASVIYY